MTRAMEMRNTEKAHCRTMNILLNTILLLVLNEPRTMSIGRKRLAKRAGSRPDRVPVRRVSRTNPAM